DHSRGKFARDDRSLLLLYGLARRSEGIPVDRAIPIVEVGEFGRRAGRSASRFVPTPPPRVARQDRSRGPPIPPSPPGRRCPEGADEGAWSSADGSSPVLVKCPSPAAARHPPPGRREDTTGLSISLIPRALPASTFRAEDRAATRYRGRGSSPP